MLCQITYLRNGRHIKRNKDLMNLITNFPRSLALGLILTLTLPVVTFAETFQVNGKPIPDKVAVVNGVALDSQLLVSEIRFTV